MIPLLGVTYLLTFIGPNKENNPLSYTVFQAIRVVLLSTQGAVITLPYCYLNTEVQGVLRTRWDRWRMVRNIEFVPHSTRASVTTATMYCTQVMNKKSLFSIFRFLTLRLEVMHRTSAWQQLNLTVNYSQYLSLLHAHILEILQEVFPSQTSASPSHMIIDSSEF